MLRASLLLRLKYFVQVDPYTTRTDRTSNVLVTERGDSSK